MNIILTFGSYHSNLFAAAKTVKKARAKMKYFAYFRPSLRLLLNPIVNINFFSVVGYLLGLTIGIG